MFTLFQEGGIIMPILTVELIFLLLAAWKAPAWVKEIGLLALISGVLWWLFELYNAFGIVQAVGGISPQAGGGISSSLFCGGLRVGLIPPFYAMLIYAISLVIRIIQKPRR